MTFYAENETNFSFPFSIEEIGKKVVEQAIESENCPYETEINLLLTDNEGIRQYNREYRQIDKETDVLSFPNVDYETPSDFSLVEEEDNEADYFNPETGELVLGDIIISYERVLSQAEAYGHSVLREFAFLIAHSMLHLFGYDHMEEEEAKVMEEKQEKILNSLGITREK